MLAGAILVPGYVVLVPWMSTPLPQNIQWADVLFVVILSAFVAASQMRSWAFMPLDVFVLVYVIGVSLSLVNEPSLKLAVVEGAKLLYLPVLYFVFGTLLDDRSVFRRTVLALVYSVVAVVGASLAFVAASLLFGVSLRPFGVETLTPIFGSVVRLTAGFPTPELLGDYLTMSLPFALGFYVSQKDQARYWMGLGLIMIVGVEILTFSHSWAGFLVAGIIFCWNYLEERPWLKRALILACLALILSVNLSSVAYVQDVSIKFDKTSMPDGELPPQVAKDADWSRIQIAVTYNHLGYYLLKSVAVETFLKHPMIGSGLGTFPNLTEKAYLEGKLTRVFRKSHPHSTFFGHLGETGLIGTAALFTFFGGIFFLGWKSLQATEDREVSWVAKASLAGCAGLLINGINADIMHFRFLWVGLALLRATETALTVFHTAQDGSVEPTASGDVTLT